MTDLLLRRVSPSRPADQDEEVYDVIADGAVVGRIMKAYAAPVGSPWFWTLGYGYHRDRRPTHGYRADARGCDAGFRAELA
jgi:hypothetical protein